MATPTTTEDRFRAFHANNPQVIYSLLELAYKQRTAGRTRLSINQLFEVIRYDASLQTTGDGFKLNNDYRSHYVRLIQELDPELGDMFETREMKAA